ncbi:MAG: tetratricopeptide repeat protein [Magnetococcales bacterium]|nr:tetratricopeptide repeat protein [Magnetococcales bacterium]
MRGGENRWGIFLFTLLLIGAVGAAVHYWPVAEGLPTAASPSPEPASTPQESPQEAAIRLRFDQGVSMLHSKQYEYAAAAFHWVLQQAPTLPEAHVNMGYSLLGLEQPKAAQDFFQSALALRSTQLNAYYGLALALAAVADWDGARGALRTYMHLTPPEDPYLAKAKALLEQWQQPAPKQEEKTEQGKQ